MFGDKVREHWLSIPILMESESNLLVMGPTERETVEFAATQERGFAVLSTGERALETAPFTTLTFRSSQEFGSGSEIRTPGE